MPVPLTARLRRPHRNPQKELCAKVMGQLSLETQEEVPLTYPISSIQRPGKCQSFAASACRRSAATWGNRVDHCPQSSHFLGRAFFVPNPGQLIWGRPRDLVFPCSGLYTLIRRSECHWYGESAREVLGQLAGTPLHKTLLMVGVWGGDKDFLHLI